MPLKINSQGIEVGLSGDFGRPTKAISMRADDLQTRDFAIQIAEKTAFLRLHPQIIRK